VQGPGNRGKGNGGDAGSEGSGGSGGASPARGASDAFAEFPASLQPLGLEEVTGDDQQCKAGAYTRPLLSST
jgi:hypothetical protein